MTIHLSFHNMHKAIVLSVFVAILTACTPAREKMETKISATEERLFNSASGFSRTGADSLIDLYQEYVGKYTSDSLAPVYLFKAATLTMNLLQGERSIGLFSRFKEKYPDHRNVPLCLFFTGYIQENIFGKLDKARETYTLFLETYPDHEFADDAKASIENLGKTPEEMIREFEARRQTQEKGNQPR